ncbi:hypothetical protein [Aneurinibacillus terranovensis]|uniref:hypothetical protein n=1 Tax=Aneurinibacillus terranovensis TaxID=278991 RepID=UPI0006888538|nr:hypothetical protein [Aneurinibacillus terranovensis]
MNTMHNSELCGFMLVFFTSLIAMKLWGRGEQARSGALEYAALSPELRDQVRENLRERNWVTGGSSPWVGPITVKEEKKLSETAVQYTIIYPEVTSGGDSGTGTEQFVVEKLPVNGKEGWFITKVLQPSDYYGPAFKAAK